MQGMTTRTDLTADRIGPTPPGERIEVIDVLRGLAICGILLGNMQWFSGYGMLPPLLVEQTPVADKVTTFLIHFLVEGKFYSIFSFLFGFGFALQISRAEARGDAKASLFKRRLFWLLVIGLLHAWLLWGGDIVSIYAVMGFVLLLFRRKSNRSLLKWSLGLMIIPIVSYLLLSVLFISFVSPEQIAEFHATQIDDWNGLVATVGQSTYLQIVTDYNVNYVVGRYGGLIFQMRLPKILAMFLLGFYAYRIGVFQDMAAHARFIRRVMIYGLGLGVIGNLLMAALSGGEASLPPSVGTVIGVIGYAFGVPALAIGIAALVATLWMKDRWRPVLHVFAPVGRMALTNYIMQTVICVTIFYGYGFGRFGTIGATAATSTALVIFAFQTIVSTIWLKVFAYGPLEWIWRQLTYRQRLDLRQTVRPIQRSTMTEV
jgi:uncharacterized protein